MRFQHLFAEGTIGELRLKNRIVLSPMSTLFSEQDGSVSDTTIKWYARRAQGGVGLVVVEAAQVATSLDPLRMWANVLNADHDRFVPGLTRLASAIHAGGGKAGIQICPGAGAQAAGAPWTDSPASLQQVSPSGLPALHSTRKPRALTLSEVEGIIESCADAAFRVKGAGFDLINLQGHGGYLLAQFLSPHFNQRTDKYGGSAENRFRFLLDMIRAMRGRVGPGYPITVKYSIDEYIDGGRELEESKVLAKRLKEEGADGIFIAVGAHGSRVPIVPPHFVPAGSHLPLARAIKQEVDTPVVVGGRLNAPHAAERALRESQADFIALGRALIADPDWPKKVQSASADDIRPCLACNACRQRLFTSEPVRCAINATAGLEGLFEKAQPVAAVKTVMVVGGGPAGMEAARVAALRGHKVILCEQSRRLGGLLQIAAIFNPEMPRFATWLEAQIRALRVEVRLGTKASRSVVDAIRPDVIFFATGGQCVDISVPGRKGKNVLGLADLVDMIQGCPLHKGLPLSLFTTFAPYLFSAGLARFVLKTNMVVKTKVAIIGGQQSGCKLAFHLAKTGKEVTVIEEGESYGGDMEETTLDALNYQIEEGKVRVLTRTAVKEITDRGLVLADKDGRSQVQEAQTVIVALGLAPKPVPLIEEIRDSVQETHVIGDAKGFGGILGAIADGHRLASRL